MTIGTRHASKARKVRLAPSAVAMLRSSLAAGLCAAVLAFAARPATATVLVGSGTIDFSFTQFHGPFDIGNPGDFYYQPGLINGLSPVRNGDSTEFSYGVGYSGAVGLSGQSVTFEAADVIQGLVVGHQTANIITFTPVAGFTDLARGVAFKVGTLTFTNGSWLGADIHDPAINLPSYFDFTLTTHSSTPEFNQVLNDSVQATINVADCSLPGGPENQADFVSFAGAPELGSLRVYDRGGAGGSCLPAGFTNTGSIDLYMKFNSLDYVGLRNPQGGFFSLSAATGPLGGVPEPASWALMVVGFGLLGAALRRTPSSRPSGFA